MVEYCDCTRPNDIGRNNPCFDCGKPIDKCDSYNEDFIDCIRTRNHDGKHFAEITWDDDDIN